MRIVVIGTGYVGRKSAELLVAAGHEVWGVQRQPDDSSPFPTLTADITSAQSLDQLTSHGPWDAALLAVSSSRGGIDQYRSIFLEGTANVTRWLKSIGTSRLTYLSSTSVYGQLSGEWVTELSPVAPSSDTGRVLVEAEQIILQESALASVVLRSAGIYGPGRGHLYLQFMKGEAHLTGSGDRWLNMIHRDDLARLVVASLTTPFAHGIYNAVDSEPVTERDFLGYLATTTGRPMPTSRPSGEAPIRKRPATHKRVSNSKLMTEFSGKLRYPSFREGYAGGQIQG